MTEPVKQPEPGSESIPVRRMGLWPKHRNLWVTILVAFTVLLVLGFSSALFLAWKHVYGGKLKGASNSNTYQGDPSMGSDSAKVTIIEYGDFACRSCKTWYSAAIKEQVLLEYGSDVRFVWRDFPLSSPQSIKAAEAARCAQEQNRFWDYHNLLFLSAPALSDGDLKGYAKYLGLNTPQFDQCLDSEQYRALVDNEKQAAYQKGFVAAPSFLINDHILVGVPTFAAFKQQIDAILIPGTQASIP